MIDYEFALRFGASLASAVTDKWAVDQGAVQEEPSAA